MFQEPKNYKENDHFFFESNKDLEKVCNAPKDKNGVFKIIELRNGRVNLIYIGYSETGGLFNEIVNGEHIDHNPRKLSWPKQLIKDGTDALDIYWYVTNGKGQGRKELLSMLNDYLEDNGILPKWNR